MNIQILIGWPLFPIVIIFSFLQPLGGMQLPAIFPKNIYKIIHNSRHPKAWLRLSAFSKYKVFKEPSVVRHPLLNVWYNFVDHAFGPNPKNLLFQMFFLPE